MDVNVMNFLPLVEKLEMAAKRALYFAEQEKEKSSQANGLPFVVRHPRSLMREDFFRERHDSIVAIIEKIKEMDWESVEEQEEVTYTARTLIAEIAYPWIKRKSLDEDMYKDVYHDTWFEPYSKDLEHYKDLMLHAKIEHLGLSNELERELQEALIKKVPEDKRKKYVPSISDVVHLEPELHNLFLDDWTKKANLIRFRLYEIGVLQSNG